MGKNVPVGFCGRCQKPLYKGDAYRMEFRDSVDAFSSPDASELQYPVCEACTKRREEKRKADDKKSRKRKTVLRLWIGGILSVVTLCIGIPVAFYVPLSETPGTLPTILLTFLSAYLLFAFTFQIFNDDFEFITDVFAVGFKSFRMPGVIFTLDAEGILRLIVVKLFLALISTALSVLWFLFFAVITFLLCGITFPFSLAKAIKAFRKSKLKKEI